MHIYHVNSKKDSEIVDKKIKEGKEIFLIVYMEGCPPCNAARPEWDKMKGHIKKHHPNNDKLVIIDINKEYLLGISYIGSVFSFPTIKHIKDYGDTMENYEDSSIDIKDRSSESFIKWIETKLKHGSAISKDSSKSLYQRLLKDRKYNQQSSKSKTKKSKTKKSKTKKNKTKKSKR